MPVTDLNLRGHTRTPRLLHWAVFVAPSLVVLGDAWVSTTRAGAFYLAFLPSMLDVLALAVAGLLLLRLLLPLTTLAVVFAIDAATLLTHAHSMAFHIAFLVAIYSYARTQTLRRSAIGAALTATVGYLCLLASVSWIGPTTYYPVSYIVTTLLAATLGYALRARTQLIEAAQDRARVAEISRESEARRRVAEDRLRTARDLHDVVARQIAVVNLQAGVASLALKRDPDAAERALDGIRLAAAAAIEDLGSLMHDLRSDEVPDEADEFARIPVLDDVIRRYTSAGLQVRLLQHGTPLRMMPLPTRALISAVASEGLANAQKHGDADHPVEVEITADGDRVEVRIANAIGGIPAIGTAQGLVELRERVARVGGSVSTHREGERFVLRALVPVGARQAA